MSREKAIWVREMRADEKTAGPIKVTMGKLSHLLDPSSPTVEPKEPYMRIGSPKRALCGVVLLTIYAVPDSTHLRRCQRCQHIADKG